MPLDLDLAGRTVLVTGGARGVGLGITRAFVDAGATVVTCSRSSSDPVGGTAGHRTCDVRDRDAVAALVDGIVDEHHRDGVEHQRHAAVTRHGATGEVEVERHEHSFRGGPSKC